MTDRQENLTRALEHLRAAQRLLRSALAFRPLLLVNRALIATELLLEGGLPAQPRLELEPPDAGPPLLNSAAGG